MRNKARKNENLLLSGGGLLLALSNLSLLSVGFSSWAYGGISPVNVPVTAEVGPVLDLGQYLTTPEVSVFQVCPSGLVVDETIVYSGKLSISTALSVSGEGGLLGVLGNATTRLSFDLSITNEGTFAFFSSSYMGSSTPSMSYSFYETGSSPLPSSTPAMLSGDMLTASISYENASLSNVATLNLDLSFSFDFSSYASTFETDIYNNLGDNPMAFSLLLKLK